MEKETEVIKEKILSEEIKLKWVEIERNSDGYILKEYYVVAENQTKDTEKAIDELLPLRFGFVALEIKEKYTPIQWIKNRIQKKKEKDEKIKAKEAAKTPQQKQQEIEAEYFSKNGREIYDQ